MLDARALPLTLLPVVAAALIDGNGRVLVQQRPAGKTLAGLWEFPGGKIEPGETPEAALVRELAEELGIDVDPSDLRPVAFASESLRDRHLVLLLYAVHRWTGEPRAIEAADLCWADATMLARLPMPAADRPLLAGIARALGTGSAG
jgi:8-oxo-dGTP diphosphatase